MVRFERGAAMPFGWVVSPRGRKPAQLRDDLDGLVEWSRRTWHRYFPPERGYTTTIVAAEPDGDGTPPLRLSARRGDFSAEVTLELPADEQIRMFGRATSDRLVAAQAAADVRARIGRIAGALVGLGTFGSLCWLSIGVADPVFVLGGLLMVVALVVSVTAAAGVGAFIGERLGERLVRRADASVRADPGVEADLRRWKSLVRQIVAQRAALTGSHRQAPFRREADRP